MLIATNKTRSNGRIAATKSDGPSDHQYSGRGVAKYRWITEAYKILEPCLPCSKNEAIAILIAGMTQRSVEVALHNNKSMSRFIAANSAINRLLKTRLAIRGDMIEKVLSKQHGQQVLYAMKKNGFVMEDETGFSKHTIKSYGRVLKELGWIEIDGKKWKWIGPYDAEWSTIGKHREKKKRND